MAELRTAILHRDGSLYYYENYADAIAAASSANRDTIVIYADLDEQIVLKDLVDIWIYPGVILNNTTTDPLTIGPTIIDKNGAVSCNVYGMGIITNTNGYSCIYLNNANTYLSVECENILATGGAATAVDIVQGYKFHLDCNYVLSIGTAIYLGRSISGIIEDINLNISRIETGDPNSSTIVGTSIVTWANGLIKIGEVLCKNEGHCFLHRGGTILARIKKLTAIRASGNFESTVSSDNFGNDEKKLTLYFDEILCIGGYDGIEHARGTGIFIGRRVYSSGGHALEIVHANTKGYVKCNELINENSSSTSSSIVVNDNIEEITIDSNYIEGNSPQVVYSAGSSSNPGNFVIRNAKIKNVNSSSSSKGILIANIYPKITLNDVKIIAGTENGNIVTLGSGTSIDVKNYGIFGNVFPDTKVDLKIGTGTSTSDPNYNYQCIIDDDLS